MLFLSDNESDEDDNKRKEKIKRWTLRSKSEIFGLPEARYIKLKFQ